MYYRCFEMNPMKLNCILYGLIHTRNITLSNVNKLNVSKLYESLISLNISLVGDQRIKLYIIVRYSLYYCLL